MSKLVDSMPRPPISSSIGCLALLLLVGLSGCKAKIEKDLKVSDLISADAKQTTANLYVEVAGCDDYEDSRRPSDSVVKAKQSIPQIFSEARYVECFNIRFDSFAHFTIPMMLQKEGNVKAPSDRYVSIISSDSILVSFSVPAVIRDNIARAEQESFGTSSLEFEVSLNLINDTTKELPLQTSAVFVDGKPQLLSPLTLRAGQKANIVLSDVAVSVAMNGGSALALARSD